MVVPSVPLRQSMSHSKGFNPSSQLEEKATEYLNWLLTPPGERAPKTKLAFAESIGVAAKSLYNWEHSEWFQSQIRQARGPLYASWYGDIVGRMKEIVDTGIAKDAIAAARVLLPHLDVAEDDRQADIDEEALMAALAALGIKVVDREAIA